MPKITIEINQDNGAFDDENKFLETARILEEIANQMKEGYNVTKIRDINGNRVGEITYE